MSENSKIEWCHHTFNPWIGCTKVSDGCKNCYAERDFDKRRHVAKWGPGNPRVRTAEANWKKPLTWNRKAEKAGTRPRVFCASLADWLDPEVPVAWLADLLALIQETPHLDWLLLTKRPELWALNMLTIRERGRKDGGCPGFDFACRWLDGDAPKNVWVGTTVENQKATARIPHLLSIPARVRFLSCEPLLEVVQVSEWLVLRSRTHMSASVAGALQNKAFYGFTNDSGKLLSKDAVKAELLRLQAQGVEVIPMDGCDDFDPKEGCRGHAEPRVDWVICGGESGPGARPMHPDWARGLRDQCQAARVPFHFKQWGEHQAVYDRDTDPDWYDVEEMKSKFTNGRWLNIEGGHGFHGERVHYVVRCGVKAAGRLLDGREWNELPEVGR